MSERLPYTVTDRKGRKVTITPVGEPFIMRNFPMGGWVQEIIDEMQRRKALWKPKEKPQDEPKTTLD